MSVRYSPRIVTDGLILCVDAANPKSYIGSGSVVNDLSGNNNNLTLTGPTYQTSPNAFVYDAAAERIISDSDTFFTTPTSMSMSAWFNMTGGAGTYRCILHKSSAGATSVGGSQFWIGVSAAGNLIATIGAAVGSIGWAAGDTGQTATLDTWWNMAAVWNGANVRVFINGVYNKQYGLGEYPAGDYAVRIGASGNAGEYQVIGKIPMVILNHNIALSDIQVAQNFDAHRERFGL